MEDLKVRLEISHIVSFNRANFQGEWEDHCQDEEGDLEDTPPVTDEFILAQVKEAIDSGELDLSELLESAEVEVSIVP